MHSALRPYVTTGLALVGTSVIALAPIAPPAPAVGGATVAKQVTQDVTLSARVITLNPSPQELEMGEQLKGSVCGGNGTPCYEVDYVPVFTDGTGYFGFGVEALKKELAGDPNEDTTVFAFSEGAVVASQWLEKHLADPVAYPAPENLTFVVIGNPSRKYGGSLFLTPWTPSPYKVIDVALQYDPTVDMPTDKLNTLAVLNATMGFFTNHLGKGYSDVEIDAEENSTWEEDNVTYVFVPSKTLPLVEPLRWIGLGKLADELTPGLQYLIEQGYDRDDRITNTTINGPEKSWSYAPINLLQAIGNIPYYSVAGTNRFANAMRASGSWWVYTPTNVLGWDPANPEMTRAFVDFLIAIPSISTPMGMTADWWARANLPMNEGCTGFPPCDNPAGITDQMFKVQLWDFFAPGGFTFTDPITPEYNPISDTEAFWGQELGLTGDKVEWYGETVYPEPFGETKGFLDFLISTPEGLKTPTLEDQLNAFKNLADGLNTTWNPFVPKSYVWNPDMTPFAYLARPLAKILCPTCNKIDPFMPEDWKVGLDVYPGAYIPPSVKDQYDPETGKYIGDPVDGLTEAEIAEWNEKAGLNDIVDETTDGTEETEESGDVSEDPADVNTSLLSARSTATVDETTEDTAGSEKKPDVISAAVQDLVDKFDKTPAAEEQGDETPAGSEEPTQPQGEAPAADTDDDAGADAEPVTTPRKPSSTTKSDVDASESADADTETSETSETSETDTSSASSDSASSSASSDSSGSGAGSSGSGGSGGSSGSGGGSVD